MHSTVLWIFGICFSLLFNFLFGRGIGEVSNRYRLSSSPSNQAFGIWGLIYTSLIVSSIYQVVQLTSTGGVQNQTIITNTSQEEKTDISTFNAMKYSTGASLILAGIWVPLFTRDTSASQWISSFVLLASVLPILISLSIPIAERKRMEYLFVAVPSSLYAGWLIVATSLSFGISMKRSFQYDLSISTLGILGWIVSLLSYLLKNPILPLPLAWAILFVDGSLSNSIAFSSLLTLTTTSLLNVVQVLN